MTAPNRVANRQSDVKRRIFSASERVAGLGAEQGALEEVCTRLASDRRLTELKVLDLGEECDALEANLKASTEDLNQLNQELANLVEEQFALEREMSSMQRRLQLIQGEAQALEQEVSGYFSEVSLARRSLTGAVDRIVRLDYRLRFDTELDKEA